MRSSHHPWNAMIPRAGKPRRGTLSSITKGPLTDTQPNGNQTVWALSCPPFCAEQRHLKGSLLTFGTNIVNTLGHRTQHTYASAQMHTEPHSGTGKDTYTPTGAQPYMHNYTGHSNPNTHTDMGAQELHNDAHTCILEYMHPHSQCDPGTCAHTHNRTKEHHTHVMGTREEHIPLLCAPKHIGMSTHLHWGLRTHTHRPVQPAGGSNAIKYCRRNTTSHSGPRR